MFLSSFSLFLASFVSYPLSYWLKHTWQIIPNTLHMRNNKLRANIPKLNLLISNCLHSVFTESRITYKVIAKLYASASLLRVQYRQMWWARFTVLLPFHFTRRIQKYLKPHWYTDMVSLNAVCSKTSTAKIGLYCEPLALGVNVAQANICIWIEQDM